MFDFMPHAHDAFRTAPPVLFLSGAFGVSREWDGIAMHIGARGACRTFDRVDEWRDAVAAAPDGAHLVAHGSAAYHAVKAATDLSGGVRSVTLIDPDLIAALPELACCMQFRPQVQRARRAAELVARNDDAAAAETVIDWWMGRRAFARTSERLQVRFAKAMPSLVAEWRAQEAQPLDLMDLATVAAPVRVVIGRKAPTAVRALSRLFSMVLGDGSHHMVKRAGTAAHLTDPHVVAPEILNFVVSSDMGWQDRAHLAVAA